MRAQVRVSAGNANDSNIGALAGVGVDHKECVGFCVDAGDNLFAGPFPPDGGIPKMSNMFVWALRVWFRNTGHSYICHTFSPFDYRPSILATMVLSLFLALVGAGVDGSFTFLSAKSAVNLLNSRTSKSGSPVSSDGWCWQTLLRSSSIRSLGISVPETEAAAAAMAVG
jgi:hypothetical protein